MTEPRASNPKPPLEEDRELLQRFRAGERAALAEVFERYVDDVARTVRAGVVVHVDGRPTRLGDDLLEHELEVMLQETFAKAFAPSARDSYDGVRPFGAYLGTIARNLLIDRGRRATRRRGRIADNARVETRADVDAPSPAEAAEAAELSRLVTAFKDGLAEEERALFEARYTDGCSHREAGERVGLSTIQVRRRDTKLRAALLAYLREHGYLEHARVNVGTSLLASGSKKPTG